METYNFLCEIICVFGKNIAKGNVFQGQATTSYSYPLRFRFVFNFYAFKNVLFGNRVSHDHDPLKS